MYTVDRVCFYHTVEWPWLFWWPFPRSSGFSKCGLEGGVMQLFSLITIGRQLDKFWDKHGKFVGGVARMHIFWWLWKTLGHNLQKVTRKKKIAEKSCWKVCILVPQFSLKTTFWTDMLKHVQRTNMSIFGTHRWDSGHRGSVHFRY